MKHLPILFLLALSCLSSNAQSRHVMLLPDYEPGIVYMKSGIPVRVPINYDAGMATMRYLDDGVAMELQNVHDIDSIRIGSHRFVPLKGRFCEIFTPHSGSSNALLVDWVMSNIHTGYKGAMGITSQVKGHSVNLSAMGADLYGNMNSIQGTTDAQTSTGNQDVFRTSFSNTYYILYNGKTQRFKTRKQILKVFADRTEEVEKVLRHHHADFQHPQTIIDALMELLSSGN